MKYDFTPKGVCSRGIHVELDGDVIRSVKFDGGCNGNTQGVAALAVGMTVDEYVKRCKGIKCGFKNTSCPDQLALALEEAQSRRRHKEFAQEKLPGEKLFPGFSLFGLDFSSEYGIIV